MILPNYLNHLDVIEKQEMINILEQYPSVFSNIPCPCSVIKHDVELLPGTHPIRQAPYRLNPEKTQHMSKEVDYLLENGLAKPSKSLGLHHAYSFPRRVDN